MIPMFHAIRAVFRKIHPIKKKPNITQENGQGYVKKEYGMPTGSFGGRRSLLPILKKLK